MKDSAGRYKLRQSRANLQKMVEVKEKYQIVISEANFKQYKSSTKFLNKSSTGVTKFLAGEQITLFSPSLTLNLAWLSLMIKKY